MLAGIDALFEGATAALLLLPPALVLFWRMTARLDPGPRALRPAVTCCAAYGLMTPIGAVWAFQFQRPSLVDEAMGGMLIAGGLIVVIAFLALLLFPRGA